MRDDRKLLELAAKAAGYQIGEWFPTGCWSGEPHLEGFLLDGDCWNPLTDDGDALRLAVKLHFDIWIWEKRRDVTVWLNNASGDHFSCDLNEDPYAATRRAIVRAAAAIGQSMDGDKS